jgi:hypothetical protein
MLNMSTKNFLSRALSIPILLRYSVSKLHIIIIIIIIIMIIIIITIIITIIIMNKNCRRTVTLDYSKSCHKGVSLSIIMLTYMNT